MTDAVRREPDFLGEDEGVLLYIARRLREAQALEKLLTTGSLDYVVEAEEYFGGFIFQRTRIGAFFYVKPAAVLPARQLLTANGYRPYEPVG